MKIETLEALISETKIIDKHDIQLNLDALKSHNAELSHARDLVIKNHEHEKKNNLVETSALRARVKLLEQSEAELNASNATIDTQLKVSILKGRYLIISGKRKTVGNTHYLPKEDDRLARGSMP